MNNREVKIKKVENGYVIKTTVIREGKTRSVEAMINLMRAMGMYEAWQEHKEEEIRRSLEKMAFNPIPEREEREVICTTLSEVYDFLRKFFEQDNMNTFNL